MTQATEMYLTDFINNFLIYFQALKLISGLNINNTNLCKYNY